MSADDLLRKGIEAAKASNKAEARRLLGQVVQTNPENEMAWLWLGGVVETIEQQIFCLEKVLAINPDNQMAQRGLNILKAKVETEPSTPVMVVSEPAPEVSIAEAEDEVVSAEIEEPARFDQNLDMDDFLMSWILVLMAPSVETFSAQRPYASGRNTLLGMTIAGIISGVIIAVSQAIAAMSVWGSASLSSDRTAAICGEMIIKVILWAIISPIVSIIVLYIVSGIIQVVAKFLGGEGSFTEQTFCFSLIQAPISIVSSITSVIPKVGPLISMLLTIGGLILHAQAIRSVHGLSLGLAFVAIVLPLIIPLACICVLLFTGLTIGGVLENIIRNMPLVP